jgi:cytochrome c biogenesis protein CcmG, thiol:disulfide interchange protein DsbE
MTVRLNEDMSKRKQMRQVRKRTWRWSLLVLAAVTLAACGSDEEGGSTTPDFDTALEGAPPKLAALHEQGSELLPGGTEAFDARLQELRGYPVVVNKWASWCGPCRSEFPYFQSQAAEHGKRVAFLGVDSNDGEDSARDFLADFPVPYPSYLDPDQEIADQLEGALAFPATAFYDRDGELAYVRNGPYSSDDELAADIERYAR